MSLFSVVPSSYPSEKKLDESKYLPCGHTHAQGSWLGCTPTVCRSIDAAMSGDYKAWVSAGRPDPAGRRG